jgi:hypothetical protein
VENAWAILDPFGPVAIEVVNYSPVQMLIHALVWQLCGSEVLGHHLVNVVLHALASALLVAVFLTAGIPRAAAIGGAALFLLHPANVEAVAWISQLKSSSSLVLALAALLAQPRRPGLAAALFALALLAKPTAAFALPVAFLLDWSRDGRVRWGWLALWAALLVAFSWVEFGTHQRTGAAEATLLESPLVLARTIAALALRYLLMAATSWGLSAFHQPEPARSPFDPWWIAALPVLTLLGWRTWVVARRRAPELAFWVWALVSFAPVSQIFPFLYPMADRYLYFILPGLIGAALLALREGAERLARHTREPGRALRIASRAGLVVAASLALVFALRAGERARLWRSMPLLLADAAANYPDGMPAHLIRARRAILVGDVGGTLEGLRQARARGYNRFEQLEGDPVWEPVRDHPAFRSLVREIAGGWIESGRRKQSPTQVELRMIAHAHVARGEIRQAVQVLERAVATGGPYDAELRAELASLRGALERGEQDSVRLGVIR